MGNTALTWHDKARYGMVRCGAAQYKYSVQVQQQAQYGVPGVFCLLVECVHACAGFQEEMDA